MLEPKGTITLSLGCRVLTILLLRGRFIGLIDGSYYVNAGSAEAAVATLLRIALARPDRIEMKKKRTADSADLVRAAREVAGDAAQDADLADEEQHAIEEARKELPRPNDTDIKEMARRLARDN
jgi:hypothetical protein